MQFFSTRNANLCTSSAEAVVRGIAPDGGLYLPQTFPAFPMERLTSMTDAEVSAAVLCALFDDLPADDIRRAVRAAYGTSFEGGHLSPLRKVGGFFVSELWHGPTCAFKDVALCFLPHLLSLSSRTLGITDKICILTATSGDTGSAALSGFSDVPGTEIIVFYPDGGVSPMQKRQMVTCAGKNTAVCAVRGNFDDAQSGVKALFAAGLSVPGVRFSSANSINIGRLAPQIAYYFMNYRDLLSSGEISVGDRVDFVVPTGNFGDILAGYFALRMGLPVGRLICASNENRVLTDFFRTGVYDRRREFHLTSSPSMDILISSNLERLLCLTLGTEITARLMEDLRTMGTYTLPAGARETLAGLFSADFATDGETAAVIRETWERDGYLIDPHTAVAVAVYGKVGRRDVPTVVLSTASPYKFTDAVLRAVGEVPTGDAFRDTAHLAAVTKTVPPAPLSAAESAPVRHTDVIDVGDMGDYVLRTAACLRG